MFKKVLFALALGAAASGALAWPNKPVTLLVPFPPGGSTDLIARQLSSKLGEKIGGTVIVDNKAGATGTIGAAQVARSPADGHTLLVTSLGPLVIAPHLIKVSYDALKDLDPITVVVQAPNVLVVPAASPYKTLADVVAYQKAHPDRMTFASSGNGSSDHLTAELYWLESGTTGVHVPYKGGGPAVSDLLGGQVDASFQNVNTVFQQIKAGKLRALAVTGAKRSPVLPDVPTMAESGLPGFDVGGFFGLYGPPKLGADLVKKINEATRRALLNPELQKAWGEQGYVVWSGSPEQLAQRATAERAMWGPVTKGISVD